MRLLASRWRRKTAGGASAAAAVPPGARPLDAAALLAGVPHLHPSVECLRDRRRGFVLAWPLDPGRPPRATWLGRLLAGPPRRHRLVLDSLGRRTVELIDGRRTLDEIAAVMARETGHGRGEMNQALLAFIGQLARRRVAAVTPR